MSALIAAAQGIEKISPLRPVTKMVAAAVSLGTGASLGPEGPSVEIGANIGMLLGQVLQVSKERHRLLLGAGAAAGLAAGFNAPIAGVFFALEVVLGTTFATSAVSVVLLAAVVSALIAQIVLGAQPAFTLPVYEVRSPLELPLYLGLGLLASLVS
jgi:H+/Cl- antiporter ClcA